MILVHTRTLHMICGAVRIKSFIKIYFARTVRFRFRFKICIEGYTEFSAQTALKQKLVNPQWTQPIPISRVLLGGPSVQ